jgi:putative transposase
VNTSLIAHFTNQGGIVMPGKAAKVTITERQQEYLQAITRRTTAPQRLVQRAWIILLAFHGLKNEQIAEHLHCERHQVGIWRERWRDSWQNLILVECEEEIEGLGQTIEELLNDLPRSGWAGKFSAEQVTQIIAVACEPPEDSGRPVTNWTPRELADEAIKRGIVESISPRQVGRFLKDGGPQAAFEPLLADAQAG